VHSVLGAGEVHVWMIADCRACSAGRHLAILDAGEQARAARFKSPDSRCEFIGAHWLLRVALSHYAACEPAAWRFATEPGGRPVLAADTAACGSHDLRFSLTHAAGGALVAITQGRAVGIDLEGDGNLGAMPEIAHRVLSTRERTMWAKQHACVAASRFALSRWTLKEAYAKARGLGLALDFAGFGFDNADGIWRFDAPPADETAPEDWRFFSFSPWASVTAALAVAAPRTQTILWLAREPVDLRAGAPGRTHR